MAASARQILVAMGAVFALLLVAVPAGAQALPPLPQPGVGTVLAAPGLPPPAVPVPGPARVAGGGDWFNGFVNDIGGDTTPWLSNASQLMYGLFALLVGVKVVWTLVQNAVKNQSIAGWGHLFPALLLELLFPFAVVFAAPAFVANALAVGLGAGSYITGSAIVGPNEMAWAFFKIIHAMLAAPFSSFAQPVTSFTDALLAPGKFALGMIEFVVALGFAGLAFVIGGACILVLVFVQVDCLVIMPLALLLVPFVVGGPLSSLWHGAMQTWFRRILRLVTAVAFASIALAIFGHFGVLLAAVNPLKFMDAFYTWLWVDLGLIVIGGLTTALPFALDAAVSGALGINGVHVGSQILAPSSRAIMADIRAARAAWANKLKPAKAA